MVKEAKDGSYAVVQMKASLFEFTKNHFIHDILNDDDGLGIHNSEVVKASSDSGDACVEYALIISFSLEQNIISDKSPMRLPQHLEHFQQQKFFNISNMN